MSEEQAKSGHLKGMLEGTRYFFIRTFSAEYHWNYSLSKSYIWQRKRGDGFDQTFVFARRVHE
jgi:hypothetical protein